MYLQLLNEAVLEEQGNAPRKRTDCSADLTISAHIPEKYVASAQQRMDLYRRIAAIRTQEDRDDVLDEMIDRYGDPPKAVQLLLEVALLRSAAADFGITDMTQKGNEITFSFAPQADVPAIAAVCGMARYREKLRLRAGEKAKLIYYLQAKQDALSAAGELVEELRLQHREITGKIPDREDELS